MSQTDKILFHLSQGKTLTPLEALSLFGCFRLASRINELRSKGYDIVTTILEKYDPEEQGVKRYAQYHLRVRDALGEIVPSRGI